MFVRASFFGHALALFTMIVWGMTFISTKLLLSALEPAAILFLRFVIGFLALWIVAPRKLSWQGLSRELHFMVAGLCGVTLYFLAENTALQYTYASNVGIIVSLSPCVTGLLAGLVFKTERVTRYFFAGLGVALAGVALISFNGNVMLSLNPLGDILAALAACAWSGFALVMSRISLYQLNMILCTRRVFFYGVLWMLPLFLWPENRFSLSALGEPSILGHLLFLGMGASALCYVTWNLAVRSLGAVRASVSIYLIPVITVLAAAMILDEVVTPLAMLGIAMTIVGLSLSQWKKAQ